MAEPGSEIAEALSRSFLFPLLGPAERDRFIAAAHARSWRAGATIFVLDDPGTSMMLVRTGTVRIGYPTPEGRTFLLAELGPGSVFGEIALLDGGPRSADATAATDCTLWAFERRDFLPLMEHNWALAEAVLRVVCGRLRSADAHIADLAFSDLPGRLAKTLIARARPGPGGRAQVTDTQGALAAMVGGSREAVNRCLRKWQRDGLVAMADGRISLADPDALAEAAGL
ncbi:MAG TPA: Crp/Fnr family transcriptional regulator [Amaricoccus sp.]|nr:Crp/Fnr family transcriptional regulator [Amaricoccus sp.]